MRCARRQQNLAMPVEGFLAQCRLFRARFHGRHQYRARRQGREGRPPHHPRLFATAWKSGAAFVTIPGINRKPFPPVLVPRYLRLPVRGRLDSEGAGSRADRGRRCRPPPARSSPARVSRRWQSACSLPMPMAVTRMKRRGRWRKAGPANGSAAPAPSRRRSANTSAVPQPS